MFYLFFILSTQIHVTACSQQAVNMLIKDRTKIDYYSMTFFVKHKKMC